MLSYSIEDKDKPICNHWAPLSIMRLHSAVNSPKREANTDGEMIASGMSVAIQERKQETKHEMRVDREVGGMAT